MSRPPKYKTPESMQDKINLYFDNKDRKVYSIESFSAFIGMTRRNVLFYEEKDEFLPILKAAKARILGEQIDGALSGKYNVAMTIFLLKNNNKYTDAHKVEQETKSTQTLNITIQEDK